MSENMVERAEPDPQWLAEKRRNRFAVIDRMTPELRTLVNEYSFNVVKAIMDSGVTKPNRIRHIVETVLNEFSPTRGSFAAQGKRAPYDSAIRSGEKG